MNVLHRKPFALGCLYRRLPVLLLAAWLPNAIAGPVYKTRGADGQIVFSDSKPGVNGTYQYRALSRQREPDTGTYRNPCGGLDNAALEVRGDKLQPLFEKYANQYGLDPALVRAVARVESCFDPQAVSRKGARGLMQLMPDTARELGVRRAFDAEQNIEGGVRYLAQMLVRFSQNQQLALAAYNAGPGAVEQYQGIPPYRETRNYVRKVMSHYQQYQSIALR